MEVFRSRVSSRISSACRLYCRYVSAGSSEPRFVHSGISIFMNHTKSYCALSQCFIASALTSSSPPPPRAFRPYISSRAFSAHVSESHARNEWNYEEERELFKLECPKYYNFFKDQIERLESCPSSRSRCALWWVDGKSGAEETRPEIRWSFEEIASLSRRTSWLLEKRCGLKRGDRLIVALPRVPEWWLVNLACVRSGIVLIPGTTLLKPRDFRYRFLRSEAAAVVVDETLVTAVDDVVDECPGLKVKIVVDSTKIDSHAYLSDFASSSSASIPSSSSISSSFSSWLDFGRLLSDAPEIDEFQPSRSSDPLMIFFTSGTTGQPKMALHTQASYGLGHHITGKYALDLTQDDVHWNLADGGWAKAAWSSFFAPWLRGSTIFAFRSHASAFDVDETLRVLKNYPVSTFCAAPTAIRMLVQASLSDYLPFSNLRLVVSGGEPLNPEVVSSWVSSTGVPVRELYGQTETVALCAAFLNCPLKPGSMGKPPPGVDLRIIDEAGKDCPPGIEGDIAVKISPRRPEWLFAGYVDDPDRTASVFRKTEIGDEFYLTGDRGMTDEDGFFWFVGRDDDVIITAGYRVGPFEVESALVDHPDVVEAAVVSSPDPIRGQVIKAFVVLTESRKRRILKEREEEEKKRKKSTDDYIDDQSTTMKSEENDDEDEKSTTAIEEELKAHVKSMTAPYKYPRKIQVVDSLPKTISGKIRRVELRNEEWRR